MADPPQIDRFFIDRFLDTTVRLDLLGADDAEAVREVLAGRGAGSLPALLDEMNLLSLEAGKALETFLNVLLARSGIAGHDTASPDLALPDAEDDALLGDDGDGLNLGDDTAPDDLLGDIDIGDGELDLDLDIDEGDVPASPSEDGSENRFSRYRLSDELGRGGLGRVMAAVDEVLGREVAVKEMIGHPSSEHLFARFLREGRIAGKLSHPNVVPVHDVGVRMEDGKPSPYFVMTRIRGRDLKEILEAVENGRYAKPGETPSVVGSLQSRLGGASESDEKCEATAAGDDEDLPPDDPRRIFTRPRLLRIFQDVCLAVAYAHDRGILHRDLKPANVMVGHYGEVYVVDWGLAKEMSASGEAESSGSADPGPREGDLPDLNLVEGPVEDPRHQAPNDPAQAGLTQDGEVVGTPSYMSPEQARGETGAVTARSDIFSLGAILYEILTFRPPYMGPTSLKVLASAAKGTVVPPRRRLTRLKSFVTGPGSPGGETVVLHAGRSEAYSDAPVYSPEEREDLPPAHDAFLPDDVPAELEEIVLRAMHRDPDRRHATALELYEDIQTFLEGEKERARKALEAVERTREGVAQISRLRDLKAEQVRIASEHEKLVKDRKPWYPLEKKRPIWALEDRVAEIRRERIDAYTKAELAFGQALNARPDHDEAIEGRCALYFERFLEAEQKENDEEILLYRGLLVRVDQTGTWRARVDAPGALCVTAFAPAPPAPARPSGTLAVRAAVEVTLNWRDGLPRPGEAIEPDGRPIPEIHIDHGSGPLPLAFAPPESATAPSLPGARVAVRPLVEVDRHLVEGDERVLGQTPLQGALLQPGRYSVTVSKAGFQPVRFPVRIERDKTFEQEVNLYPAQSLPSDVVQVPAGTYIAGETVNHTTRRTEEFFIGRFAVTLGDYLEFLHDLDPEEAHRRRPREQDRSFLIEEKGTYRCPGQGEDNPHDLAPDRPVFGVSWFDAMAFAAWRSRRDGRVYTLAHEDEWEKAARGVDRRLYPWGDHYDWTFSNTINSFEGIPKLLSVFDSPIDASPYGVRGLGGNMATWTLNAPGPAYIDNRLVRGGAWYFTNDRGQAGMRMGVEYHNALPHTGIRLIWRHYS